jgi:hypothetical protein
MYNARICFEQKGHIKAFPHSCLAGQQVYFLITYVTSFKMQVIWWARLQLLRYNGGQLTEKIVPVLQQGVLLKPGTFFLDPVKQSLAF